MRKWFSTDYSETVGWILIFSKNPHEFSIPIKWWKISSRARLRACAPKIHITRIADFCLFWPRLASVSARGIFFLGRETSATFRDRSAMLGEHLSQKSHMPPPKTPFLAENVTEGVKKRSQFLGPFLSKGRLNLWAKYFKPKNRFKYYFFSSQSYKSLKFEFVWSRIYPL